jgi:hypothetical protein
VSNGKPLTFKTATAVDVCAHFNLEKSARRLLEDGMEPREFVETLVANSQHLAAIEFVAHALPAREAVWWGCLCLQHACGNDLSASDKAACKAAVRWVLEPTEENRAAAKAPAEAAGAGSPAGALATAAHQTGGSIAPPNFPPLPPEPFAPAKAVANAVKFASCKGDPFRTKDRQRLFVELGIGGLRSAFCEVVRNYRGLN